MNFYDDDDDDRYEYDYTYNRDCGYDDYDDGLNWDCYNSSLDMDQQDPDFWG